MARKLFRMLQCLNDMHRVPAPATIAKEFFDSHDRRNELVFADTFSRCQQYKCIGIDAIEEELRLNRFATLTSK